MILRAATDADVDALLDVQQPAAVRGLDHIFPQDQHPFPRAVIAARWLTEIADPAVSVYLCTEHDGSIQGFATVRGHELLHFGTALPTWGTGLASRFHSALLDATAEAHGMPTTLTLRVFEENRRADVSTTSTAGSPQDEAPGRPSPLIHYCWSTSVTSRGRPAERSS